MGCIITDLHALKRPCRPQMGGVKDLFLLPSDDAALRSVILFNDVGSGYHINLTPSFDEDTGYQGYFAFYVEGEGVVDNTASLIPAMQDMDIRDYSDLANHFYHIDVSRQGAVVTSEAQVNRENNTVFYQNSVVIPATGLTAEAVDLLRRLAGGGCIVVAEMYSGQFIAFGLDVSATLSAASVTTGANWNDMPGATITLMAEESVPVYAEMGLCGDDSFLLKKQDRNLVKWFKEFLVEY